MTLRQYLEARNERPAAFARRAGIARQQVWQYLERTRIPSGPTALRVIEATRREPAPDGGTVTLEELVHETLAERAAS